MPKTPIVRVEAIVAVQGRRGLADRVELLALILTVRLLISGGSVIAGSRRVWRTVRIAYGIVAIEHFLLLIHGCVYVGVVCLCVVGSGAVRATGQGEPEMPVTDGGEKLEVVDPVCTQMDARKQVAGGRRVCDGERRPKKKRTPSNS